tara:strand:+ start:531 stop:1964 length:1434 start_codon:yes stop_codon:yes gene_type:complete
MNENHMHKTELLSPAGSIKNMQYAFAYGADAVYAGQPRYSLRVRENEFNRIENIAKGVQYAHKLGKQFYIASNISPHNDKVKSYLRDMEEVVAMKPDAMIMSDPGIIMLVREKWPDLPIHLSVQANAVNWATVKFWQKQGLTRVILSRELSLDEIAEIKQRCPEMEIEVFVHGALCMAYSGRCLLSGYMTHRDSNQGACTNSCRWKYQTHEAEQSAGGEISLSQAVSQFDPSLEKLEFTGSAKMLSQAQLSQSHLDEDLSKVSPLYLLQEQGRPGEFMPAYEDEHGTYIMNSKDLRAVQHVKRLIDIGVESLKIEGRTKSYYYAARTAQVYRRAIDDAVAGRDFNMALMDDLEGMANRGFTEGFYRRHLPDEYQNYETGNSTSSKQLFVADVVKTNIATNTVSLEAKNKFEVGDSLTLLTPTVNIPFKVGQLRNTKSQQAVQAALGSGYLVDLDIPELTQHQLSTEQLVKGLLVKDL